jgi:hypothetical protein
MFEAYSHSNHEGLIAASDSGMTDETQTRPVEALLAVRGGLLCHQLSGRNPVNKRAQT